MKRTASQHILVIRLSAMGDVAITVPVLKAFVKQHPEIKITVVSRSFLKPLFDNIENVEFFGTNFKDNHNGLQGLWRLFKELKKLNITHVADLHNVLRSKVLRSLFKLSKSHIAFIDKGRAEKKALIRSKNKVFKQLKPTYKRYADVFSKLGFTIDLSENEAFVKPDLNPEIKALLGNSTYHQWVGIAPFATYESKTYPLDLMEQVIADLSQKKYHLFLFGGKSDATILSNLAQKYSNITCVAGKLGGLKNELNLIANLDLMLSMDSGNAHFAAMQNVKTITLWGSTHPYAGFAPFNQPKDFCILPNMEQYPNLPCSIYGNKTCENYKDVMRSITPKSVVKKITEVLS